MTNQEAIKIISQMIKDEEGFLSDDTVEAHKMAIKALEQVDESVDTIDRQAVIDAINTAWTIDDLDNLTSAMLTDMIKALPSVKAEPKAGHWSRKTKVDAYDIAGVKTWGIKCQCDRCDFTTIVVEDFGYYKYCPNCGARMVGEEDVSQ